MNVIKSMINVYALFKKIEQKGMTFEQIFAIHSPFLLPSFFRMEEKRGKE